MKPFSFCLLYFTIFASVRVTQTSKAMQTTAIRTVANSLPENEVILLTLLISRRYIPYTDLRKKFVFSFQAGVFLRGCDFRRSVSSSVKGCQMHGGRRDTRLKNAYLCSDISGANKPPAEGERIGRKEDSIHETFQLFHCHRVVPDGCCLSVLQY